MAIDHTPYELALRARALSLAVTPAPDWVFEDLPTFTPRAGVPYITEQYVPGPAPVVTLGPVAQGAEQELTGLYVLQVFAPSGTGLSGTGKYTKALLDLFAPGLAIIASNGDVVRIRANPVAPYREQIRSVDGRSMVPVNIPFRVRTPS